jgi:hypothetical protein
MRVLTDSPGAQKKNPLLINKKGPGLRGLAGASDTQPRACASLFKLCGHCPGGGRRTATILDLLACLRSLALLATVLRTHRAG